MCNDNWTPNESNNQNRNDIDRVSVEIVARPNEIQPDDFFRIFDARDFNRMPMPQYIFRIQRFDFRRETLEIMSTLFDQWLTNQSSHNVLLHHDEECDVCGTHVNDLALVAPMLSRTLMIPVAASISHDLKHISCGHTICSTCLVVKRVIFVNLGLPICCNLCGTCWLQF